MDSTVTEWLNLIFRWIHVVAGVLWIGHLYFFNFVNGPLAKTYDADSKKKVVPELMPRALYFFRWGAAYTWITGVLLLGIVYYHGGVNVPPDGPVDWKIGSIIAFASLLVAWPIYDLLWKAVKKEEAAVAISFVLATAYAFGMSRILTGRSTVMHVGALFGTLMMCNVWMRIWPSQRKIIAGIKGTGPAADPAIPALAGLRSKHNTYMSIPLIFAMVANHFPGVYGSDFAWAYMMVFVAVGWGAAKFLYTKSASAAPTQF